MQKDTSSISLELSEAIEISFKRDLTIYDLEPILSDTQFKGDLRNEVIDIAAKEVGISQLGPAWLEVSLETGRYMTKTFLRYGMAYGTEVATDEKTNELLDKLMNYLSSEKKVVRIFVSGETFRGSGKPQYTIEGEEIIGYAEVTNATFSLCIVFVTTEKIAILWGEEED